ncbi:transporter, small conductance mechanosensitiveion channel MscS family protein [Tannerella forsythia KS16]|jgi:transporter, mscS family|uniref:Transporter, small conductance mechanosensitive ion channel MscS family protein n=4 Tax=Tannerella forsythia TaxID=28112 RepID=G8UK97_TANFA|nr:mechanosensitive ion channel domain-containing protein [Tannerella forsythia]AEW20773.1 transporter, small conductance mechanosensitive ion channel MscS family protein [Tannerella forsythia 92A2]KKY61598.1 mechanosensitive ion channel protein MscS [Tannerella forsythia]OLQ20383.1 mechanosensitive ion channel protein MscS [Tannerella forsythia]PDP44808.1 mechanosensitive ion channel protein MscS [Tannerella forsythia]PDP71792.1 mechanosensitive ion channel protein MscS [Tannerella forsythia]
MQALFPDFSFAQGMDSDTQKKIIVSVVIILLVWLIRITILRFVWKSTNNHKSRYLWKRIMSFAAPTTVILLTGMVWANVFHHVGTFLGLLSAGIAIALKDLLENMAGWLFIMVRKPFTVGDRVQIGEDKGDIIDIRLFQFTILEVGNRIDAEQSTGRIIHIPNRRVFTMPQANYDQGFKYIWNEVQVRITFDSNWTKTKEILLQILNQYGADVVQSAEEGLCEASKMYYVHYQYLTPIVYLTLVENGIRLTGRYLCEPRKIRSIESAIWEDILTALEAHDDIRWAYPTQRFVSYNIPPDIPADHLDIPIN